MIIMRKAFIFLVFWILGILQPSNIAIIHAEINSDYSINAVMLLDKNKDQIYPSNVEYLDKRTPIKLDYNKDVKKYIDYYLVNNPSTTAIIAGRSEYYFPLFEEHLSKHNLPMELKNIAVIESGLNPLAVSTSGAVGLWQFLFHTSKMFDLAIDSYVDERRDPALATEAACKFLGYLYQIFNDWQLAITAYNCGPGMIEQAIEQSGGSTDYWVIRNYLSDEAKNYYPKFVAACYTTSFYKNHGISPKNFGYKFEETGKVKVKQSVWLKQIAAGLEINEEELKILNPVFKQNYVPVYDGYAEIVLPKSMVKKFQKNEDKIYAMKLESKNYFDLRAEVGNTEGRKKTLYYVKPGEYFHQIAMNHGCTIYDIMEWNNMNSKYLNAGQALIIYAPQDDYALKTTRLKSAISEHFFVSNN